jgi:hypothetical protein
MDWHEVLAAKLREIKAKRGSLGELPSTAPRWRLELREKIRVIRALKRARSG